MKKIFNIFFAIVFLLGAVSCVNPIEPNLRDLAGNQQIAENAKVTLYFGTTAYVATKASMAAEPGVDGIESIHVLVFNKEGILVETAKASKFVPVVTNGAAGVQPWAVTLTMAGEERRLHFIANLSEDQVPEAGSETAIFEELATTYPNAAYWQRRVLSYGIQAYKYNADSDNTGYYYVRVNETTGAIEKIYVANPATDGSYEDAKGLTVNKDDYIDREGCKIVDGTGFYAISEVVEKIPMVRNFARLKVKSSWVDEDDDTKTFSLKRAALVNKPKAGLIAPYDAKQSVTDDETESWSAFNHFAPEYIKLTGGTPTEPKPNDAKLKGYTITLPSAGIDDTKDGIVFKKPGDDGYIELFTYERGKPTSKPMCILVGGTWEDNWEEGDDLIWYKVELRDVNGAYFPIYRDFTYIVDIEGIESNSYTEWEDAFDGPAVGDISNSVETKTLSQISDDKGLTLWVEYIDKAVLNAEIDANNPYVTLLYTCYREKTGYTTLYFNDLVSFSRQKHEDYPTLDYATALLGTDEDAPAVEIIATGLTRNNTGGYTLPNEDLVWNAARVKLNKISEQTTSTLRSQIHVLATVTADRNKFDDESEGYDKQLYRDVTYTVMPKQNLSFALSSYYTPDAVGETRTLTITLPTALTPSLFPLTLKIEANNNCLNPVSSLTTETGKSAFGTGNANSFYFLKTIAYSEYYNAITKTYTTDFPCEFKSIIAPGSAAQFALSDKKGYFETVFGPLVPPTFSLSATELPVKASQTSASFDILSNVGTWTVTADNGAEVIRTRANDVTSGQGKATIAVSFPDNMSGNETKTYTVTVSLDSKSQALINNYRDLVFTIEQNTPVPHMVERTVTNSSFTLSNASSITDGDGKVNLTHGSGITYNNGNRYFTYNGSSGFTFSFAPVSNDATVTITGITFNWNNKDYRPSGIALSLDGSSVGSISPGGSSTNGSWTGEQIIEVDKPLIAELTRRNNGNSFRIYSISVSYTYQEQDGWE